MTAMEPLHVHIPYVRLRDFFEFIKKRKYDLEIYFPSTVLDQLERPDLEKLRESLDWNPALTLHAPFVDMSPGAIDPRAEEGRSIGFAPPENRTVEVVPRGRPEELLPRQRAQAFPERIVARLPPRHVEDHRGLAVPHRP